MGSNRHPTYVKMIEAYKHYLTITGNASAAATMVLAEVMYVHKAEPPKEQGLCDVKEVAEMLSVSPRTVWRMLSAGQIPKPIKVGSLKKWRRNDIAAMIDLAK